MINPPLFSPPFSPYQIEVALDRIFGENPHSIKMNYTNNRPDLSISEYMKDMVTFTMYPQPLGCYYWGVWEAMWGFVYEQPLVASYRDFDWYRRVKNHLYTTLPFIHRIMRSAYQRNATYERVFGMETHHVLSLNGLFALMYGDRLKTPMFCNGTFGERTFEFLKQNDAWMMENKLIQFLTPQEHARISNAQKGYIYFEDIRRNIEERCDGTYPKNPYYKFEDNMSIVNERYLFGEPRYSQKEFW